MFIPFIIFGQEKDGECVEYEQIEMYNLRKSIIEKQNLDVWPSIVEIKNLSELNIKRKDSLILFIAETDNGDKLRMTNSLDLSKFTEIDYKDDCKQEGTILTDLKLGKINLKEMKAEIFCRKKKYAELKIKN
jgi:RNA recognition motif-containing protein